MEAISYEVYSPVSPVILTKLLINPTFTKAFEINRFSTVILNIEKVDS